VTKKSWVRAPARRAMSEDGFCSDNQDQVPDFYAASTMDARHLRALIGERHPASSSTALRQAEGYLTEQFKALGLDVSIHPFKVLGDTHRNVIGTRPASHPSTASDAPLIVAAHYDTVRGSPGADDNASALAVLLEAARSLRSVPLSREVRFIAFSLEEEDLLGSLAYVSFLKQDGHEIGGAIVLECVGYACATEGSQRMPPGVPIVVPTVGDFLAIIGNTGNGELLPDSRRSDHAAFWQYGYPAVMLTDTANFRNPNYHASTDTIETLDLGFMEKVAQSITAAVMHLCAKPCD
jgi:aminopeptidase YwaD